MLKFKPIYFVFISILLLLLHFGFIAYIHIKYVHPDTSFWEHFLTFRHLTLDEQLNRFFTAIIVLSFSLISAFLYAKLFQSKEKILNIHKGINFISKPVSPTELAKKVRFVLDNKKTFS